MKVEREKDTFTLDVVCICLAHAAPYFPWSSLHFSICYRSWDIILRMWKPYEHDTDKANTNQIDVYALTLKHTQTLELMATTCIGRIGHIRWKSNSYFFLIIVYQFTWCSDGVLNNETQHIQTKSVQSGWMENDSLKRHRYRPARTDRVNETQQIFVAIWILNTRSMCVNEIIPMEYRSSLLSTTFESIRLGLWTTLIKCQPFTRRWLESKN